jgi:hypothetical protein
VCGGALGAAAAARSDKPSEPPHTKMVATSMTVPINRSSHGHGCVMPVIVNPPADETSCVAGYRRSGSHRCATVANFRRATWVSRPAQVRGQG